MAGVCGLCGGPLEQDSRLCPACRLSPPPKQNSRLKNLLIVLGAVVLLIVLIALEQWFLRGR